MKKIIALCVLLGGVTSIPSIARAELRPDALKSLCIIAAASGWVSYLWKQYTKSSDDSTVATKPSVDARYDLSKIRDAAIYHFGLATIIQLCFFTVTSSIQYQRLLIDL